MGNNCCLDRDPLSNDDARPKPADLSGANFAEEFEGFWPIPEFWCVYRGQRILQSLEEAITAWTHIRDRIRYKGCELGPARQAWQDRETMVLHEFMRGLDEDGDQLLEWPNGEVRSFVRRAFVDRSLPVPPLSKQAWTVLLREYEPRPFLLYDFEACIGFLIHVAEVVLTLASGKGVPVEVAPKVFIHCNSERSYYDQHPQMSQKEREMQRQCEEAQRRKREEHEQQQKVEIASLRRQRLEEQRRISDQMQRIVHTEYQLVQEVRILADADTAKAKQDEELSERGRLLSSRSLDLETQAVRKQEELKANRCAHEEETNKWSHQLQQLELSHGSLPQESAADEDPLKKSRGSTDAEQERRWKEILSTEANEMRRTQQDEANRTAELLQRVEAEKLRIHEVRQRLEAERLQAEQLRLEAERTRQEAEVDLRKAIQNQSLCWLDIPGQDDEVLRIVHRQEMLRKEIEKQEELERQRQEEDAWLAEEERLCSARSEMLENEAIQRTRQAIAFQQMQQEMEDSSGCLDKALMVQAPLQNPVLGIPGLEIAEDLVKLRSNLQHEAEAIINARAQETLKFEELHQQAEAEKKRIQEERCKLAKERAYAEKMDAEEQERARAEKERQSLEEMAKKQKEDEDLAKISEASRQLLAKERELAEKAKYHELQEKRRMEQEARLQDRENHLLNVTTQLQEEGSLKDQKIAALEQLYEDLRAKLKLQETQVAEAQVARDEEEALLRKTRDEEARLQEDRHAEILQQIEEDARCLQEEFLRLEEQRKEVEMQQARLAEDRWEVRAERLEVECECKKVEESRREAQAERQQVEALAQRGLEEDRKKLAMEEAQLEEREANWRLDEALQRVERARELSRKARDNISVDHDWHQAYRNHTEDIAKLLTDWESAHVQIILSTLYDELDQDQDGFLEWNNSEIRHFVNLTFTRNGLPCPVLEDQQWHSFYQDLDMNRIGRLNLNEACDLSKRLHQAALLHDGPMSEFDLHLQYSHYSRQLAEKLLYWDDSKYQAELSKTFQEVDTARTGNLTWNDSEIRRFVRLVFDAVNLPTPRLPEQVWYQLFREIDTDGKLRMSKGEAFNFTKHMYRRILDFYPELDVPNPPDVTDPI